MSEKNKLKIFSYEITKKQYWLVVLVLFVIALFIRIGSLPPETPSFELGESIGSIILPFLLFFGGLYWGLTYKKNKD